ncbi:MAG: nucleoid-associated protein [Erysipelotrichaceae bacterium]|nr:nucleoid-associated protein [Erysipelotrichaceae bacterium]MDD3809671.1 nucleoid-associated protein [Erysipelotrichaceae bacterium]
MNNTIIIDKIILHMLDMEHSKITYSNQLVAIDEALIEYYRKKLEKVFANSNIKEIVVPSQHHVLTMASDMTLDEESFITVSCKIAQDIYELASHITQMPNSNLLFVECKFDGEKHIVMIKLNYKVSPTIKIEETDGKTSLKVVNIQSLPPQGGAVEEAIIVNVEKGRLYLIEKKFEIDGKADFYLNEQYIKGEPKLSDREKLSLLNKAVKKVDSQLNVFPGDPGVLVKQEVINALENFEKVKPLEIAQKVMASDYQAQTEVETLLLDLGFTSDDEIVNIPTSIEKMARCKLILDDRRTIELPLDEYLNLIDFNTQTGSDGKTELILKNIEEIKVK